jgi:hypothetical protein
MYDQELTFSNLPDELRTRQRRRLLALVLGLIVLLAAGIVAMLALAPDGRRPASAQTIPTGIDGLGGAPQPDPVAPDGGTPSGEPSDGPAAPDGGGEGDGQGGGDSGDDGGTPDQPSGPCATATRALAGAPDPVKLKMGATKGSFTIYNCTDESVAWLAATRPSVTLSEEAGTLEPGATHVLGFTIDTSSFDTQKFTFKIKVYSTTSTFFYVDVNGSKLTLTGN